MVKCFLVPMTDPPYSRENPQHPMYMDELRINWSGSPLFNAKYYVIKANSTDTKLLELQGKVKIIDFHTEDDALLDNLPEDRKLKDKEIKKILKLDDKPGEKVKDFINRSAQSEGNFAWDKDSIFVPDEGA